MRSLFSQQSCNQKSLGQQDNPSIYSTFAKPLGIKHAGLDVSVERSPAGDAAVGGDWAEFILVSDDLLVLTIGHLSGHDSTASSTMLHTRSALIQASKRNVSPARALQHATDSLSNRGRSVIVTAIFATYERATRRLTFVNAGHPPPPLVSEGIARFLHGSSADLPLGIQSPTYLVDHVVQLPQKSLLVLYTDGVTEHRRDPISGENDLLRAAREAHDNPRGGAVEISERVFASGRRSDDAAIIALRLTS